MAFLSNFTDRSKEIVKSVVDMAKHLGIHILTEGVETLEQYTFLRNIGCEMLQGFLFSKPLPYIQAIEYIEELGLTHETPEMRRYYSAAGSSISLRTGPWPWSNTKLSAITSAFSSPTSHTVNPWPQRHLQPGTVRIQPEYAGQPDYPHHFRFHQKSNRFRRTGIDDVY